MKRSITSRWLAGCISLLLMQGVIQCRSDQHFQQPEKVANAWAELTLHITRFTPMNSPTYASRAFGYIGLTMYESVVHGFPDHVSMVGQLNGLDFLPVPKDGETYDWVLSLNAGQARILHHIYNQTSDDNKAKIDSLEQLVQKQYASALTDHEVEVSIEYGRAVADSIFAWSKSDGGHRGYLFNADKTFKGAVGPGKWEPPLYAQAISHKPLHPHWGENRTFLLVNEQLPVPAMIPYDTAYGSPYYDQYYRVYKKDSTLTQAEKEAAIWWGDDPWDTFTPPGHSYYLGCLSLKNRKADLITCATTYARVGMAVADAFIKCWNWKYYYYSERPSSFIPRNIDKNWASFWPDPPFPAFPSGHATQAAAAAAVFMDLFGNETVLVDSAHYGRKRDDIRNVDFKVRTFSSFWQVAQETADSRFYGGIHTPQDNEVGLAEGRKIGENVNHLVWTKRTQAQ